MGNIMEQMLEESKRQLELEFEHKKELARIKSCQNNEIKELKEKYKKQIADLESKLAESDKETLKLRELYIELINLNIKEVHELEQQLIQECKEHQEFCKVADEKVKSLEEENKRLSKNLRISWTKRMQFYNGLLINKLRDVRDKLDKELFDGCYEKDISVGAVKVVAGALFDKEIEELKGEK